MATPDKYVDYKPYLPYWATQLDTDKIWRRMPHERRVLLGSTLDGVDEYNRNVVDQVRKGINNGELVGSEAFAAIGKIALFPQVYHGSKLSPELLVGGALRPSQTRWSEKGRTYNDGPPAVCFTPDVGVATFMAIMGGGRPELNGLLRGYQRDPHGRLWQMVSKAALEHASSLSGCVYTKLARNVPQWEFDQPEREPEHRSLVTTDYEYAVRVGSTDLSPDTLIIDGKQRLIETVWARIRGGEHPLALADNTEGLTIEPLGGEWSIDDHPYFRN